MKKQVGFSLMKKQVGVVMMIKKISVSLKLHCCVRSHKSMLFLNSCSILELLIPTTNRICDKGKNKVSPVYSAIYGGNKECLEMLLKEGYSPDAQECPTFSCRSPMCMIFQRK